MRTNKRAQAPLITTHEHGPAARHITAEQQLRRLVMANLLWENQFYVDGQVAARRVEAAAKVVPPATLARLAVEARNEHHLRHVPLFLLAVLAETGKGTGLVSEAMAVTIRRADELSEFLSIYAQLNGIEPSELKKKLSHQVRKGLARAFQRFDAYALAKYDRANVIRLRDVAFLAHAKPKDNEQGVNLARLVNRSRFPEATKSAGFKVREAYGLGEYEDLPSPDTWEVALSSGANKRETWERLLTDGKLGYLALLRNLRNMVEVNVDLDLVKAALLARKGAHQVLPFRYVAAARACPQLEPVIDQALQAAIGEMKPLPGKTVVLVDVSGSMNDKLSAKSDLTRMDAAATLASVIPGDVRMFSFSNRLAEVPPRRGMAGVDAIIRSQEHSGTRLGEALAQLNGRVHYDRLIVITDEQSSDRVPAPAASRAYMINVAAYQNGVGYGSPWVHIDGFSEAVLKFIAAVEQEDNR